MSWRLFRGVVLSLSLAAGSGFQAWAQDPPPESPPESPPAAFVAPPPGYEPGQPAFLPAVEDPLPGFMTLDRMDAHSRVGLQVGWNKYDNLDLSDGFIMRFNPYGQFVFPGRAGGIYAQLPLSHFYDFNGSDATGVGNTELGGFFMPMRNSILILRAGLAVSTASTSGDEVGANVLGTFERVTDFLLIAPNYTSARVSTSSVHQMDMFFFRGDFGFDFVVDKRSADSGDPTVYARLNVAAGIRVPGAVDLAAELVNLRTLNGDADFLLGDRSLHTLGFSLRTPGVNQLHLGTVFPLDDTLRGDVWIVSLGYQRAMN